jgi:hypothetical protein
MSGSAARRLIFDEDGTGSSERPPIPESDPAWQAALRAPLSKRRLTEEERLIIEEAKRGGRFFDIRRP